MMPVDTKILEDAIAVLGERAGSHGDAIQTTSLAHDLYEKWRLAYTRQAHFNPTFYVHKEEASALHESVHMIMHKLARIACGDFTARDHFVDIIGYATIADDAMSTIRKGMERVSNVVSDNIVNDTTENNGVR